MSKNFYETEFQIKLQKEFDSSHLRNLGDSSPFFEQLAKNFPVSGSKIDWTRVPNSIEGVEKQEFAQTETDLFIYFFDEIYKKFCLFGDVIYIGDSATDFAIEGSLEMIRKTLPELLCIPQHHYFIGSNYSWCICMTMEGDIAFGFNPNGIIDG